MRDQREEPGHGDGVEGEVARGVEKGGHGCWLRIGDLRWCWIRWVEGNVFGDCLVFVGG